MSMLGKTIKTFRISNSLTKHVPECRFSSLRALTVQFPRICARLFRRCSSSSGKQHNDDSVQKSLASLSIIREHARKIDVIKEDLVEPLPSIFKTEASSLNKNENNEIETWKGPFKQLFANVPETLEQKLQDYFVSSIQFSFDVDKCDVANHLALESNKEMTAYDLLYQPTNPLSFKSLIQGTIKVKPTKSLNDFVSGVKMSDLSEKINAVALNICANTLQKAFLDKGARMTFSTNPISISSNVERIQPPVLTALADTSFVENKLSERTFSSASGTKSGKDKNVVKKPRSPYVVCVKTDGKGCISPGNENLPKFIPQGVGSNTAVEDVAECQGGGDLTIQFASMNDIIGELGTWDLMSRCVYIKALEEAAKRRKFFFMIEQQNAAAKAKNCGQLAECAQPELKQKDTPRKMPAPCKIDPCDNPCIKKQKPKPCTPKKPGCPKVPTPPPPCRSSEIETEVLCSKKGGDSKKKGGDSKKKGGDSKKKEDPCKKKQDPCKKKEDPCKKKVDPCKKKVDPCKKKEDPCKKKEDPCKKKEDPCKKKEDPCKKKEDPCKKKEDPCKKKEDPCKKKEDPCKKKEDPCKKKEDPCKKRKDPCKKEDPCKKKKEDPCKKKKEDPCKKKKEDPCKKNPCKKADASTNVEVCEKPTCAVKPKPSSHRKNKSGAKARARARISQCCLKPAEKREPMSMADFIEEACCRKMLAEKAAKTKAETVNHPQNKKSNSLDGKSLQSNSSSQSLQQNVTKEASPSCGQPKPAKRAKKPRVVVTCGKRSGNTKPNCKNHKLYSKKSEDSKRCYSTGSCVWSLVNSILNENLFHARHSNQTNLICSKFFSSKSSDKSDEGGCVRNAKIDKGRPRFRIDKKYPTNKNCWNEPNSDCPKRLCKDDCQTACKNKNPCGEPCRARKLKKGGCVGGNPERPGCPGSAGKNKGGRKC